MQTIPTIISATFLLVLGLIPAIHAQSPADTALIVSDEEATVQVPFGKQQSKFVTSSMSTVKGSALQKTFNTNIGNTLYGRLAGLTVSQRGNEPGSNSPDINARGLSTFGPGNKVLIIVDGFIGDYEQLMPEEIEEISLLKDAAATAIYGSRGANGVLLVTTKRGREAPLRVSFGTQQGFSQATSLPKFLDAYNYAVLYNEALNNNGQPARYTAADLDAYQNGSDPLFHPNVNWYDEVLRKTAPLSNYNLSFRGGNSTAKYFVMLNNIASQGLYKNFGDMDDESRNSTYSRFNFRSNVDVNLTKRLSATLLLSGTVEDKANPNALTTGNTFTQLSLLPPNAFPVRNPDGTFASNTAYSNSVASLLKTGYAESNGRTLQSSFRLNHDLGMVAKGLSASAAISFNNYFRSGSSRTKTNQTFTPSKGANGDTIYTKLGQTTSLTGTEPNLGQYRNLVIQAFVNYHRVFGKHDIKALAMLNTDNATIDKRDIFAGTSEANLSLAYKTNAGSTRINYVFDNRYIAEFSMAYMGSENYAPGNRYGYFPAASAGWILSNENFLQKNKVLSFLKIRGSYGLTGNDEIGGQRFMYYQTYPFGASYYFGTNNASTASLSEGRLANPAVTWEKEKKTNLGIDVTLFNRFDITLDIFKHDRSQILVAATRNIPLMLGYTDLPSINQGKVTNRGFDASLRYRNSELSALQFFAEATISYARNKIIYNAQPLQLNAGQVSEGRRIGQPYGLKALGLFMTDAEALGSAKPIGVSVQAGDVRYEDAGGPFGVPDGIIDANDNQPIGNTGLPEFTMGLHTGLKYKSFDVDLMFQGVSGYTVYLGGNQFRPFQNFGQAGEIALERWTPSTAASATFPRLTVDNNSNNLNNYRFSSFYQRNGSFVKLRSAELGYTLSSKTIRRIKLQEVRLFITGTNLFTIDHIKYGDPEALGIGYPAVRTLTLGTRIQL